MVYKKCEICNNSFLAIGNNKTCSKICSVKMKQLYQKDYVINNKEKFKIYSRSLNRKLYRKKYNQTEKRKQWSKNYEKTEKRIIWRHKYANSKKAKTYRNNYEKNRYKNDVLYKLRRLMSKRLGTNIKIFNKKNNFNYKKPLYNFSIKELKTHLEKQFDNKMNWDNYNDYWEIEHLIPQSWATTKKELMNICWDINNLFPMKKSLNRKKSNKFALINGIRFYDKRSSFEYFKELYK